MRGIVTVMAGIGTLLVAGTLAAQEPATTFSKQGTFVVATERLVGLSFTHDTEENTAGTSETKTNTTDIAFGVHVFGFSFNPYVMSQLGFDYFVIDHLSLGAGFDYWHGSGTSERTGQPSRDLSDVSALRVIPRVGFGIMFTDVIGLWARGGLSYYNWNIEDRNGDQDSEHGFALTAEGLLVIAPINHVGIQLGPTFDIGLSGKGENRPADPAEPTTSHDVKRNQYGVMAGLMVWF